MCNIDHINNINMFEFLTFIKVWGNTHHDISLFITNMKHVS